MTAVVHRTKKGYCAVWPESLIGRSGNEMASAVHRLLKVILVDHPECRHLILWSDSCVPQNRNSIMAYSLQFLLDLCPQLCTITQRFCEPGHSSIQDVDNLHNIIGRFLTDDLDIHSPISLVRFLNTLKPNGKPMYIHNMVKEDFLDFNALASSGAYGKVKFGKTKEIKYSAANLTTVGFRTTFTESSLTMVEVLARKKLRSGVYQVVRNPKVSVIEKSLSKEKVADLRSLLIYMSGDDLRYMTNALK